jgi:hypothetical protein
MQEFNKVIELIKARVQFYSSTALTVSYVAYFSHFKVNYNK